jgi:hypothetical protein
MLAASISISDATATEGSDELRFIDRFVSEGSGGLSRPRQMIFGPDGNADGTLELYVSSVDTNQVLRYDGKTGAFLDVFVASGSGGLNNPADLKFGPDGHLYVNSFRGNQLLRFNGSTGAFIDVAASGLNGPHGLTIGTDGSFYIANFDGNDVLRYNASGVSVFVPAGSGGLGLPRHAVFGPDANADGNEDLYVSSQSNNRVLRYDGASGEFIDVLLTTTRPVAWLEFGTDGLLYTTIRNVSEAAHYITRFDVGTGAFVDSLSTGRDAWSFAIGPDGLIYHAGNAVSNNIQRFGLSSALFFNVTLSEPSDQPISVTYSTSSATATSGADYSGTSGTLTFAPGQTTRTILVRTIDDAVAEPTETFTVNLSNAVNANIADGQGIGTIQDSVSLLPALSITDVTITEGINPQAALSVELSFAATAPVTVEYSTADNTALAGSDYAATSGSLTFEPGQTRRTILVPILNDAEFEPAETFFVNLTAAAGATIADAQALATIEDSDFPPLTLLASSDGQRLEVHFGNPPIPGAPVLEWPMDAKEPLDLDIDIDGSDNAVFVELPAGSDGPQGGIVFPAGGGLNELHIKSGSIRIDSTAVGGTLKTTVAEGAELITTRLEQNEVLVDGRLTLLPGRGTSVVTELTLGPEGVLDLADNALVLDYSGTSPVATIREKIFAGRGGSGFGPSWTQPGINSTTAAEANKDEPEAFSIGFAENAALPLGPYTTFRGQPVDDTSILIAYTRTGDANLDGVVDDQDVTIVGASFAPGVPQPHWAFGDFDYNGFVDDADVTLLGVFYDPSATPLAAPVEWAEAAEAHAFSESVSEDTAAIFPAPRDEMNPLAEREVYDAYALAIEQLYADSDDMLSGTRKRSWKWGV